MVKLYGKAIRINKASQDKTNSGDVGANLFIGNLDPDVDEKVGGLGFGGSLGVGCQVCVDRQGKARVCMGGVLWGGVGCVLGVPWGWGAGCVLVAGGVLGGGVCWGGGRRECPSLVVWMSLPVGGWVRTAHETHLLPSCVVCCVLHCCRCCTTPSVRLV